MLGKIKQWLSSSKNAKKRETYTPRIKTPDTQAKITWPREKKY